MPDIEFVAVPCVSPEQCEANAAHALTLGLPAIERVGHVAVVGGGPSLADHLDELRAWDGPIWAINQTFMWLKERGIKSTFLTVDPMGTEPWLRPDPGDSALVALHVHANTFEALKPAHVRTFRLGEAEVRGTLTTATVTPHLASLLGHKSVTFFGCDSSFVDRTTHVYDQPLPDDLIIVECGGEQYATKPEFMMQADTLATFCRELPGAVRSKSAGLMHTMIANPDRRVVAAMPVVQGEAA